jgi:peptidoglycan-associated lipoprotein
MANSGVNTFLYAGLAARFDIGGKRVPEHEVTPVPAAAPAIARAVKPSTEPTPEAPPSTAVSVEADIVTECHLNTPRAFFEFDSANLTACDLSTINDLADCFTTGPLKGRKLEVVGHADPRGTDEYNMKLGESRAQSVAEYLTKMGVPAENLTVTSKGRSEATGFEENGWAYDRRVEIRLVK